MDKLETATLGGGCFWCTEAIFKRVKGVKKVTSGYSGIPKAEVVQIEFNPDEVSYEEILNIFFKAHDPTMINQQGVDIGPQYRSIIFYHNTRQQTLAEKTKSQIKNAVTEINKFESFEKAEEFHQNFYENNRRPVYCRLVIDPKLKKLGLD